MFTETNPIPNWGSRVLSGLGLRKHGRKRMLDWG
jgi:hypothetical protein